MIIQTSHFLDIKEKQSSKITKVKKEDLNNFINISGGKFDVIIDDVSHAPHRQ